MIKAMTDRDNRTPHKWAGMLSHKILCPIVSFRFAFQIYLANRADLYLGTCSVGEGPRAVTVWFCAV